MAQSGEAGGEDAVQLQGAPGHPASRSAGNQA